MSHGRPSSSKVSWHGGGGALGGRGGSGGGWSGGGKAGGAGGGGSSGGGADGGGGEGGGGEGGGGEGGAEGGEWRTVAVTCECSVKSESCGGEAQPAPPAASATHSAYRKLAAPSTPPGSRTMVSTAPLSVPP